jgi:hypothetical protein
MSELQNVMYTTMSVGQLGQISRLIPHTAKAMTITSATASNVFGLAFTTTDNLNAAIGGTGIFAGILGRPHEHSSVSLANVSDYTAIQYETGLLMDTGAIDVEIDNAVLGGYVQFNQTTGALSYVATSTPDAGNTLIKNAQIESVYQTTTGTKKMCQLRIVGLNK